jgi:hypothetical protein
MCCVQVQHISSLASTPHLEKDTHANGKGLDHVHVNVQYQPVKVMAGMFGLRSSIHIIFFLYKTSPGRGFEAASPQILRREGLPRFFTSSDPLVWEPPALGLPFFL